MENKPLNFITSNPKKVFEFQKRLFPLIVKQINIELEEIQSIDPKVIIKHKLKSAFKHHKGPFLIEDVSLCLECMGGKLPGPFIKFFNQHLGSKGIAHLAKSTKKFKAKAVVIIAYAKNLKQIKFFTGVVNGKVVSPRGAYKFGFDEFLVPSGHSQTLSEMKAQGNFALSPRSKAIDKLKKHLQHEKY
jgi:non-canonical purine NTP pyrophosphatase (RdgB/HAM1 family)